MLFTHNAKRILLVLFVGLIWLPLVVMLITPDKEVSELENRRLASPPEFNVERPWTFFSDFEQYFNDHFGFRQPLIYLFRLLQVKVFEVAQAGSVIFGKGDWLFRGGADLLVADIRNNWPYSDAELAQWARVLSAKHQALARRGIGYLFVFAPSKDRVYPEKLPASMNRVRERSRAEQLIAYLRKYTEVPILDLRPVLLEAKQRLRTYHRTDTHWNSWGAYVGYRAIVNRLQKWLPELRAVQLDAGDFAKRKTPGWNLARMAGMPEALPEIEIYPAHWHPSCAVYSGLPENFTREDRNNNSFSTRCESGNGRLLLFRDSFALALMPYLSESFAYIRYYAASPVPLKGMLGVVKKYKPDVVIEERSTRWLRKPYG